MARIHLPRQIGIVVATSREARGLTQLQVAKRAGVSRQLVNRLEVGTATGISLAKLLAILEAAGCALDVYPLDAADNPGIMFGPASSTGDSEFDPLEEYPLDESLFEADGEVSL